MLKDYAIGHPLIAVAEEPTLASTLVMKGGTALKKLYFGDYRFSEDLDFSCVDAPRGDALESGSARPRQPRARGCRPLVSSPSRSSVSRTGRHTLGVRRASSSASSSPGRASPSAP